MRQAGSGKRVDLGDIDCGLEMSGVLVTFERFAVTFEPVIDGALADIGVRQGIVQREGVVIRGEGFVQPTELFKSCGLFDVGSGMVVVEGENFLEADEGAGWLFQIEEGIARIQQRRESLDNTAGRRRGGSRRRHRADATLDRSQRRPNVQQHGDQADFQKNPHDDRDL